MFSNPIFTPLLHSERILKIKLINLNSRALRMPLRSRRSASPLPRYVVFVVKSGQSFLRSSHTHAFRKNTLCDPSTRCHCIRTVQSVMQCCKYHCVILCHRSSPKLYAMFYILLSNYVSAFDVHLLISRRGHLPGTSKVVRSIVACCCMVQS